MNIEQQLQNIKETYNKKDFNKTIELSLNILNNLTVQPSPAQPSPAQPSPAENNPLITKEQEFDCIFYLAHAYKSLKKYDKARECFECLQEAFPNKHQGWEGIVNIAQHQQDWQQVVQASQRVIEKFPKIWQGYWYLGYAHKNLAEYPQAEHAFKQLQEQFPNMHQGWEGIINIAQHQQNWQKSLDASLEAIEKFPQQLPLYNHKGMALKNLKRFDEAEEFFTQLKQQFPNSEIPYIGLANVYSTLRKWKDAIYTLQQGLIHFPSKENLAKQLISQLLQYNEPDEALRVYQQYIVNPDNIANKLLLTRIYQIKEGNQCYLEQLENLYQQYPDDISVALAYANALITLTMEEG